MKIGTKLETSQFDYLKGLIDKHPTTIKFIDEWIADTNEKFSIRIQDGQQKVMKKSTFISASKSKDYSKDIANYNSQRKQLQQKLSSLSKSRQKGSRQSLVLSDEERLNFLRKMKQKQQEVKQMKQQNARIREEKERMKEEQQKFQKAKKMKEEQNRKRRLIQKRLEEIQEEKQRRQEQIRQRNRQYQQVAHEKTLFHRLQESFNKLQNINLEEKKKKLAQIRQIHKPMSKTDFEKHAQYIKQCQQLTFHRKSVQKQGRNLSPTQNRFYKSHWYKSVLNEQKMKEEQATEEKKQLLKELKDREKKYAQYIRHNHMPDTDDKLIQQIEKRFPEPKKKKKAKEIRQMGLYNLKASKEKIMTKEELEAKRLEEAKLLNKPIEKPKNYLEQLKKNRRSSSLTDNFLSLDKVSKPDKLKSQSVKSLAQKLQKKAEQRQQLQRVKNKVVDTELDEMYMGVLNAKLRLLPQK